MSKKTARQIERRIFGIVSGHIDEILRAADEIAELARHDPQGVFDTAEKMNISQAYVALAGVYRTMLDNGEGDFELITQLWDNCMARSSEYLGIYFSEKQSAATKKMKPVYLGRPGHRRVRGKGATFRRN